MRRLLLGIVLAAVMVVVMASTAVIAGAQDPALGDWPTGASAPGCEEWWEPDYQDFGAEGVWIHWYQWCYDPSSGWNYVWDGWYGPM